MFATKFLSFLEFPELIVIEVVSENFNNETIDDVNNQYHQELLKNQGVESIVENTSGEEETSFSQEALATTDSEEEHLSDLKEFGVDTEEPDLFSSENRASDTEEFLNSSNEQNEEDDLEIPAFLRRQKN